MKKEILIKIGLVIFIFALNFKVQAVTECTQDEMDRLKELANNVEFTYEYQITKFQDSGVDGGTSEEAFFKVTAINLSDELKVISTSDNREFTKQNPTLDEFYNGTNVKINFKAYTRNLCSGKIVLTKNLKLPYVNKFYLRDECKENLDFKYCSEYGNYNISEEEFQSELEKYKNPINRVIKNDKVSDFLTKYGIYLGIGVVVIISVTIVIIIKKRKKDSDL